MSAWVCDTCFSVNEARHGKCYHCRGRRTDTRAPNDLAGRGSWQPPMANTLPANQPTFLYTGVVLRALAYLVDVLLMVAYLVLVFSPFTKALDPPLLGLVFLGGVILYFVVGWAEFGTTVGMRIFRLSIVRASDGAQIGYRRALVRLVVLWAVSLFIPVFLAIIPMVIDHRRRGLHDHAAGSVVIRPAAGRLEYPPARVDGLFTASP